MIVVVSVIVVSAFVVWSIARVHRGHLEETMSLATDLALSFDLAIQSYVAEEIRPRMYDLLDDEEFVPETMSSSFISRSVFERVRSRFPRYLLKFSTDNPRNPRNLATPEEMKVLEYLRENPGEEEWRGEIEIGGRMYHGLFRARRAEASCLRCHGDPGDAPAALIERYGAAAGFGFKEGDLIAADTVAIPMEEIDQKILADSRKNVLFVLCSLAACLGAIIVSLKVMVADRLAGITAHISDAVEQEEYNRLEPLPVKGSDEVSMLAASYNILVDRLRYSYSNLEEQVRQRTASLASSNERLQMEVQSHRRTEEALKESESRLKRANAFYRNTLDSMPDPVCIVDAASYRIVDLNRSFTEYFGKEADDLLERTCHEVMKGSLEKCVVPELSCPVAEVVATRAPSVSEQVHRTDGEQEVPVEVSASPVFDELGAVSQVVMVVRDITARRASERAMERAKEAAEAANRDRSQFLANMSHEIRTPLNGIIGMVELAMDTVVDEDQRKIFGTVSSEASALLTMIDDVLDYSRIEAGKLTLERMPFNLHTLVEDLGNSMALQADKKGLEMNVYVAPDLPARVEGDPGRVRQVLLNLITNSLKFTEEGEVFLRAELQQELEDGVVVRFSIKDTGIGIPEDKREEIFESFTQADGTTTRKYGGTGLGLPIARQLVHLMGGRLTVESTVGAGSTFRATILLGRSPGLPILGSREQVKLKGKKVLIVDDSRTSLSVLKSYLGLWGCSTMESTSGEAAVEIIRSMSGRGEKPDLVITDFRMQGMDGFTLAEHILGDLRLSGMPIILMTSRGSVGDGARCREIGISGYLTKPVGQEELKQAVIAVLTSPAAEKEPSRRMLVSRHSLAEARPRETLHILVVEDYPTIQNILLMHLRGEGYEVDLAVNGRQGVEAYRHRSYDIVFMDIQMPEMDGYQATREIRAIERERHGEAGGEVPGVPVIAITAHTSEEDRQKCFDVGMNDFLSKPVRRAELLRKVRNWSKREREPASAEEPGGGRTDDRPIDLEEVLGEFLGRERVLVEALRRFLKDLDGQAVLMREAIERKDGKAASQEAHSIKGAARFLTAEDLAVVAQELEESCREGRFPAASDALGRLQEESRRLRRFLEAHLGMD